MAGMALVSIIQLDCPEPSGGGSQSSQGLQKRSNPSNAHELFRPLLVSCLLMSQ